MGLRQKCLVYHVLQAEHLRRIIKPDFLADDDVVTSYLDELCREPQDKLCYLPGYWISNLNLAAPPIDESGRIAFESSMVASQENFGNKV